MAKNNQEAFNAMTRARAALYIETPFYGILALRLKMQEERGIQTLDVSHTTMRYNPDYILSLDESLRMTAVAHELGHIIHKHIDRCGPRNPKKWNRAADYAVNWGLKVDGMPLKDSWLYDPQYADMSAEHIYTLLPDDPDDENSSGNGGAQDMMMPGDPDTREAAAIEWDVAVIQAANTAKSQGSLPASMSRFIDEKKGNKVNWRQRLRRFAMQFAKDDFSWSRAQRRMLPWGYYLPSLHTETMALLAVGIDTSGSIDQFTLDAFGGEISAMKMMARPQRLVNIYCDARVNHVDEFNAYQEVTFKLYGGGGTNFIPPFEYIEDHDLRPDCFIYLTDGEGRFPKEPPPYPVLWVMTTDVVAPFGETIRIEI